MSLQGRNALVTGGSRGIGRAICLELARQGANVAVNYAGNAQAAEETAAACRELGVQAVTIRADVADAAACEAMVKEVISSFGSLHILVNNAGITRDNLALSISEADFDAVLDTKSRQIEIHSGWAREMQPVSWKMADKRTYVHWAEKKYDIIVFGMPTNFHYGNGMGTNPIQMMQALSAQVIRHRRIMSDRCVFIVSSICDGYFHDERWPYLRELYDLFQHDYMNILPDMNRYGEYFATKEEYIRKYRFANAFHPFHGFSMMSCGHLAEEHTSAIYILSLIHI